MSTFNITSTFVLAFIGWQSTMAQEVPQAPTVEKKIETLTIHGDTREDPYYWLRERENPDVIKYLNEENAYLDSVMAHTKGFQESLFGEITGRIKQDDDSVPYRDRDYFYYTRFKKGQEYPIHYRKLGSLDGKEEILLDGPALAAGHEYFAIRGRSVSAQQDILAYAIDTIGRRKYTIHFRNLVTGETLSDSIPEVSGNMAWAEDNKTLFYTKQDPDTLRSFQIYRHEIGTPASEDSLVYEEKDETFSCYLAKSKSRKYLMIFSDQTLSTEIRILKADNPSGEFRVFHPRESDHLYDVDHLGDAFYIRTNDGATNFKLMKTSEDTTAKENWTEVIGHRSDVLIRSFELFDRFTVVEEREKGLVQIRVIPNDGSAEYYLDFGEPTYRASTGTNVEADSTTLRFGYTSMTTPNSTFDYDMVARTKILLKQQEVLGEFETSDYVTERHHATARDGVEVPISLVYRKGFEKGKGAPLLLTGYGSYGSSSDATFSSARLSLLDRGFVFAIAHIRGGQEMGRQWYENGKLLKKKNTFTDFIDCADYLVSEGYADQKKLFAMGGSAGGLLMGAVMNMRPELFHGIVANVPFVDVVTTMLDDTIPLTTSEYDEWGNPNIEELYWYILSYSPYDQVEVKDYPNLLVTTGLHDSQVQYWEPAKWVAKLRDSKTDSNRLILKTDMGSGHGGASGRFKRFRDTALEYAFLLDLVGIRE